jgi:thymidylate kinase
MLICFEGLDRSGKTAMSSAFVQWLNTDYRDVDGTLLADPHLGDFIWTKEPTFTTEEADLLNSKESPLNEYQRERVFFESRVRHQELLATHNVVCDRYVWSGIAYATVYSPNCVGMIKELYMSEDLFAIPDLYVFVDTPPEVCYDRDPSLDLEILKRIKLGYDSTRSTIKSPIITVQGLGGEERSLNRFVATFVEHQKAT